MKDYDVLAGRQPLSLMKKVLIGYVALTLVCVIVMLLTPPKKTEEETATSPTASTVEETQVQKHYINGVPVISQQELSAGCETYACTMLLQAEGFDITETEFADKYLICSPITYGIDGTRFGPDMYSAFAGTVYNGYGIYAPAMSKSMNDFFSKNKSELKAHPLSGVSLEQIAQDYTANDILVMVWATVNMDEPYEKASWVVDYVDENAKTKKGDTFTWLQNEHCLVLIGFDEKEYYFADSCAGTVSHFDKNLCQQRYDQLGTQAIAVY